MAGGSEQQGYLEPSARTGMQMRRRLALGLSGVAVAMGAAAGLAFGSPLHAAAVIHHSSNVAYVWDDSVLPCASGCGMNDTAGPGSGGSIFVNGVDGTAPGTGNTGMYTAVNGGSGAVTVSLTNVPFSALESNPNALNGFDTVIAYQPCSIGTQPAVMGALNQFIQNGNKLMIFDADGCSNALGPADWSGFLFPFTTNNPGPQGAPGTYDNVTPSALTTGLTTGSVPNDQMGDANVFVTHSSSWFQSITGTNVQTSGIVQAYARTSSGGIVIYEGEDFWFTDGSDSHMQLVFDNELNLPWSPDNLPGSNTITLSPVSASSPAGSTVALTAHVTDTSGTALSGVSVTFTVTSGPDNGITGMATTNPSGNATFNLMGTAGVDTVQASYVDSTSTTRISNTAFVSFVTPGVYTPLSPFRVVDTRTSGGPLGPGGSMNVPIAGASGPSSQMVPSTGVQAVVLNVTGILGSAGTFVTVFPTGAAAPTASNLNLPAGAIQANLVVVALGTGGQVTIFNAQGNIDIAVDVEGYFSAPSASPSPGTFHSIAPFRVCDTRHLSGTPCADHPLGPGAWEKVSVVSGSNAVPSSGASAVAFNLTAVQGTQGTFLSAVPPDSGDACPSGAPSFSNLNITGGDIRPNRAIVPLGPSQDICVYNAAGNINFLIDVNGWFGNGSDSPTGLQFFAVAPTRICDTRSASVTGYSTECSGSTLGANQALPVTVVGVGGLPSSGPQAVVANVTAVVGTAGTFFTLYPTNVSRPLASDLNPGAGQIVPNLCIVLLGGSPGALDLYNAAGTINAIVDVAGWFQ